MLDVGCWVLDVSPPGSPRPRHFRRLCRRTLAAFALATFLAGAWLWYFLYLAPLPESLARPEPLTTIYLDTKGRLIAELAGPEARSHRPIAGATMGPWIRDATVALEDRRFYSHAGVDLVATGRALVSRHGGGSTITQQLVKMAIHRNGRTIGEKLREMLLAWQLERRWSKAQILDAYLNRLPYGNRLIGIEAAAQGYFDKHAAELSEPEAVYLAGIPRLPSRFNPWRHPAAAAGQFRRSLRLLAEHGAFQGDATELAAPSVERHLPPWAAPHYVDLLRSPRPRGVVSCTLDLDLQHRAEQLVAEHFAVLHRIDPAQAAMVIIENGTGAVRAMVGSRDYRSCQLNGVVRFHDCGSTLKPFLYATAIDRRILTAATLLPDTADAVREAYGDYDPHNFVQCHAGPVRVREALNNSLNVPAVVAVSRMGARQAFDAIGDWGIRFDRPLEKTGAGFILGNVGVRLLDLTAAFAGLERGGLTGPPRLRESDRMPLRRRVAPETAEIVTDVLCDNSARLISFGPRSALAFETRVACKTGTSAGFRDGWAVGCTKEHTVGVWVGNVNGSPMDHISSIASAAPLWRRMMDDLLLSDHPLPKPSLRPTRICALTGLRPGEHSTATLDEYFLPGTEPLEDAGAWFAADGHPLLPREYAAWVATPDNHLGATLRPQADELAILSLRDEAVFVLDGNLPATQQQLELQANRPDGVTWKMNGRRLSPATDGRVLWPLAEGRWTLEAAIAGQQTSVNFVVRRE
jgi:penicillin-binding protein 1C